MFTVGDLVQKTNVFNLIAGGGEVPATLQAFKDQQKVLVEEVKEIQDGLDNNDIAEIVDGVIDTFVVNAGHWLKLESLGIDMGTAAKLIAENNLSKYVNPDDIDTIERTIKKYKQAGTPVYTVLDTKYNKIAFRRIDTNKIMKPVNFVPVDISGCIPVQLRDKGLV